MNKPRRSTTLAVTPLEDRALAATLAAPLATVATPVFKPVVVQVGHITAPDPVVGHVGTGVIEPLGLRRNHNETFVRRRKAKR